MVIVETRAFTARIGDLLSDELFAFSKKERVDLTAAQKRALRRIVETEYR